MSIYPLSIVGLFVELLEKEEEHNGVHANPPDEGFRVIAVGEEKLEGVKHDSDELNLKGVETIKFAPT
jgi:hypothetical protein